MIGPQDDVALHPCSLAPLSLRRDLNRLSLVIHDGQGARSVEADALDLVRLDARLGKAGLGSGTDLAPDVGR